MKIVLGNRSVVFVCTFTRSPRPIGYDVQAVR